MTPSDDVSRFRFEKVVPVKVLKDLAAGVMNPKSLNKCFFFFAARFARHFFANVCHWHCCVHRLV